MFVGTFILCIVYLYQIVGRTFLPSSNTTCHSSVVGDGNQLNITYMNEFIDGTVKVWSYRFQLNETNFTAIEGTMWCLARCDKENRSGSYWPVHWPVFRYNRLEGWINPDKTYSMFYLNKTALFGTSTLVSPTSSPKKQFLTKTKPRSTTPRHIFRQHPISLKDNSVVDYRRIKRSNSTKHLQSAEICNSSWILILLVCILQLIK